MNIPLSLFISQSLGTKNHLQFKEAPFSSSAGKPKGEFDAKSFKRNQIQIQLQCLGSGC